MRSKWDFFSSFCPCIRKMDGWIKESEDVESAAKNL